MPQSVNNAVHTQMEDVWHILIGGAIIYLMNRQAWQVSQNVWLYIVFKLILNLGVNKCVEIESNLHTEV